MTTFEREVANVSARGAAEMFAHALAIYAEREGSLPPFALSALTRVAEDARTMADLLEKLHPPADP